MKKLIISILTIALITVSIYAQKENPVKIETVEVVFGDGFAQNVYILYNSSTKDALIVDPGKKDPRIEEFITVKKLKVRKILNTHGHGDHMGANCHYASLYKVNIVANRADQRRYRNHKIKPAKFLTDEKELKIPGFDIKVIYTPGHTPGSTCYLINGYLLSGDTLFYESVGKTSTDAQDALQTKNIKEKLLILKGNTEVFPGHGSSTTIEHEKKNNEFLQ